MPFTISNQEPLIDPMIPNHILVYAARHGTTTLNAAGCFRGPINIPLDDAGVADAKRLAMYFKGQHLAGIFASDKIRAIDTAKAIGVHNQAPIMVNSNLQPLNVGAFAGKPKAENEKEFMAYIRNPDVQIPGGESLSQFRARVQPVIQGAVRLAVQAGVPVLIVAHSSVIHEIGNLINQDHVSTLVKPGGVAAIYLEGGKLKAAPLYRPEPTSGLNVDTVS